MPNPQPTLCPRQPPQFGGPSCGLRRKGGSTLQASADRAGVAVRFLSQAEPGKATASLGAFVSPAGAPGGGVGRFIATPRPGDATTRTGEQPRLPVADAPLLRERQTTASPGGALTTPIIHVPAGDRSEGTRHTGDRATVALDGWPRQTRGKAATLPNPGDSPHFADDTPRFPRQDRGRHGPPLVDRRRAAPDWRTP